MIEELLKLLFANLRPLDVVTLAAIVAGFVWQIRRERYKPRIDKADASGKITASALGLMDSAIDQKSKADERVGILERENIELEARLDALALDMAKQQATFELELARQQAEMVLLQARVSELEASLTLRDTAIGERDRIIAGLREQMGGLK